MTKESMKDGVRPIDDDAADYNAWWDSVHRLRVEAEDIAREFSRLRSSAEWLVYRAERLIEEGRAVKEIAEGLGKADHYRHLMWRACLSWAALVRLFGIDCDQDVMTVCREYLRSEEMPKCV